MIGLHRIAELEALAQDGVVIVLKIDGERKNSADIFTVVLSGGHLNPEDFFRMDGRDLSALIDNAISFYRKNKVR
jgi:hypothetical protein